MIVHTMTMPEAHRDAVQDLPALHRKAKPLLRQLQRSVVKDGWRTKEKWRSRQMLWRSPRGNHWVMVMTASKRSVHVSGVVYWTNARGKLSAAIVTQPSIIELSTHFLDRLRDRHDAEPDPLLRLQALLRSCPDAIATPMNCTHNGEAVYGMAFPHGLGLGLALENTSCYRMCTYVDHARLRPTQRAFVADQLGFFEEVRLMGPAQLARMYAQLVEEIGERVQEDLDALVGMELEAGELDLNLTGR